jgi:hypothetical protein
MNNSRIKPRSINSISQDQSATSQSRNNEFLNSFRRVGLADSISEQESEDENREGTFRRRRRLFKKNAGDQGPEIEKQVPFRSSSKKKSEKAKFDDELDPYDSDPGGSYRQHCLKLRGMGSQSCLRIPAFMKSLNKGIDPVGEEATESTMPPSPMGSDADDILNQIPASLPAETRIRYSLRSSIGDGSAQQPTGPSVMDRRELRPNGVALNVSHWSARGCRAYMEDR